MLRYDVTEADLGGEETSAFVRSTQGAGIVAQG